MPETTDSMIETFARDYLQPLYYFCLRKTGSAEEGEELAADIGLQVITALRRGTVPAQFSAWVWRIARNRYAAWCDTRAKSRERMTVGEPDEELPDTTAATPEETVIAAEELQLLRRELAFIGQAWRELIVAYYFEHRTLRSIAASLGIPEGTAKTRLFQSRKRLLEEMKMSREFGKRSFKPETIHFAASGEFARSNPWDYVNRTLPNNILLEASNNPSTPEELAVELGVAMPYMEDEVKRLIDAKLLKKVDARVVTNFPIIDAETQRAARAKLLEGATARASRFADILRDIEPQLLELGMYRAGTPLPFQRRLWAADVVHSVLLKVMCRCNNTRGCIPGTTWSLVGSEETDLPDMGSSLNEESRGHIMIDGKDQPRYSLSAYTFPQIGQTYDFRDNRYLCYVAVLGDILSRNRPFSTLTHNERDTVVESPYVHIEGDAVVPDIAVTTASRWERSAQAFFAHPDANAFLEQMCACYRELRTIIAASAFTYIPEQVDSAVFHAFFELRAITLLALIDLGYLEKPEDPRHDLSMIYLTIAD